MRKIELINGIQSSVLGFGCAPILGSVDSAKAKRALDCAIELGINHLDLARSYGYGEAETFVGKLIENRRKDLIIASKFGIMANWKASLIRPVKPLLRSLKNKLNKESIDKSSMNDKASVNMSDSFHDRISLNAITMRASLEKSLKELRTDYLDYFFIHEPHETISEINEIIYTADLLKKEGKIRAFGLAYMRSQEALHSAYLSKFDILQFDNSPGAMGYDAILKSRGKEPNILFSPLKGGSKDMKAGEKLIKLANDFPKSIILCSMYNEAHIKSNAALFT